MGIVDAMSNSTKGLKDASSDGGFFYFVSDQKGVNAAIIAFGRKKDGDGKKTFRVGRGLLKDFRKEHGKAVFSQGEIQPGSSIAFEISKGNAKPTAMKRAFKSSDLLHEGVGAAGVALLKAAKIRVGAPESSSGTAPTTSTETDATEAPVEVSEAAKAWAAQPSIQDLDLDPSEIMEMFAAEKAFEAYNEAMPLSESEETALQVRQAETEEMLDSLTDGQAKLAGLIKAGDTEAARELEQELNTQRIALAQKTAIGPNPFDSDVLSQADQQAFTGAMFAGLQLLMDRLQQARREIDEEVSSVDDSVEVTPEDQSRRESRREELTRELMAIEIQFRASRRNRT